MKRKDYFVNAGKALNRADLLENLLNCFSDREAFYEEQEEPLPIIYYDELTIWTNNCIHHADWTGPDEYDSFEESYEFDFEEAKRRDAATEKLSEFVFDKFIAKEEIASIINKIDNSFLIDYVNKHLLSVSCLFEEEVIDAFYEDAEEEAQKEYDDYDPYD